MAQQSTYLAMQLHGIVISIFQLLRLVMDKEIRASRTYKYISTL